MTLKVYNEHPYASDYMAGLIRQDKDDQGTYCVLDQTIFYPEGGGQPCDLGAINGIEVTDVQLVSGEIRHYVKESIKDDILDLTIDFRRRFDHMQNHLGQHILSSAMEKLFSANTVGFHMGDGYVTIDLDQKLTSQNIEEAETFANQIIMSNLPVHVHYPDEKSLSEMPLRKQPKFTENIRVIEIDNFDFSPCGGTHPTKTSEVNIIKVLKHEKYKSGVRIEFICGRWAQEDYKRKNDYLYQLAKDFSVKPTEVIDSVNRMREEQVTLKKEIKGLTEQLLEYKTMDLLNHKKDLFGTTYIEANDPTLSMNAMRNMGSRLTQDTLNTVCLLTNGNQIIISASKDTPYKIGSFFKENISKCGGKGGGNDYSAQGALNTVALESVIENFKNHIEKASI